MNYELAKFANRGTFKWIGTFQGFSTERDYFAHKDIEKVILSDVQTPDGNIVAVKHKTNKSDSIERMRKKLRKGDLIMFTAYVLKDRLPNKEFYLEGIEQVTILDISLINKEDLKQTIWDLRRNNYSIKKISFITDTYTDKVFRIIRENDELARQLGKKSWLIRNSVRTLTAEGKTRKEVSEITGISVSSVATYLPYNEENEAFAA